jgi:hypothetical protein
MSNNTTVTFVKLQRELQKALSSIETTTQISSKALVLQKTEFPKADSLLARCEQIVRASKTQNKPNIRVLQHFACSGGTLISKCISALPNVFLLSEVHPTTELHMGNGKAKFLPSDITSQARYVNVPDSTALAYELFKQNIRITARHTERFGGTLVIREHTHSDFCRGKEANTESTVIKLLSDDFNIIRLTTIRDPVDAFRSLTENKWFHFEPFTFEEYCQRFLAFVNTLEEQQIVRYEDFVIDPMKQMQIMADKLALPFDDSFIDTFSVFRVSGDSGRSGDKIEPRSRKALTNEYKKEILESKSYKIITQRFGYLQMGVEND